ncbi:MAG: polysaccharide export protein [Gemmatimonadetes bacterium]|nr:polysaccharide export protein [Gemmatimonadota bacterium]
MNPLRLIAAVAAVFAFAGVSSASAQMPAGSRGINPVLIPGDVVRVKIWREPDLSGDFGVDESGVVVFPKIGGLPVGRLTSDSVKALLVAGYARFLQDPSVELTFLRRVQVLGQVKNPGLYHVDATMKVTDVLAMAGGVTSVGNTKNIELWRDGKCVAVELSAASAMTDLSLHSGDQLQVSQRSWLSLNAGVIGAGITSVAVIVTALIRR